MDSGYVETKHLLNVLEYRINEHYSIAEKEIEEKIKKHYEKFAKKDAVKYQQMLKGEISKEDYNKWRTNQMMMGKRWENLKEEITTDLYNKNDIAYSMVYGFMPEVYATNHNFATYQIEQQAHIDTSYALYDAEAVERLIADNPDLIPIKYQKLNELRDKRWNKKNMQSVMIQGILQGESIPKIAKRFSKAMGEKNRKCCIRNARTMTTSARNGGRFDAYKRAQGLGIEQQLEWMATHDGRTRDTHRWLDREQRPIGEKFSNGCRYPADPEGKPSEVYNCRCRIKSVVKGLTPRARSTYPETINGMSYEEWKKGHNATHIKPKDKPKPTHETTQKVVYVEGFKEKTTKKIETIANRLVSDYNTPLKQIVKGHNTTAGEKGFVGIGERDKIVLNTSLIDTVIHEFAHTMALSSEDKLGLSDNKAFWSEIRKVRTRYTKEISQHQTMAISAYSETNIDEFYAEAFTLAKMKEMGLEIPFGLNENGLDFANEVLAIIDKYFKKRK